MSSRKRIEANRRNARKSTGPRTEEGKARSSRNATTHGLTAQVATNFTPIVPIHATTLGAPGPIATPAAAVLPADEYGERLNRWVDDLQPVGIVEHALVERACRASMRLDRCARYDHAQSEQRRRYAAHHHDQAERARVEFLGPKLIAVPPDPVASNYVPVPAIEGEDPATMAAELKSTARGVAWMLGRWEELARDLEEIGHWEAPQRIEAIRLMGWRPELVLEDEKVGALFVAIHALAPPRDFGPKTLWRDCCQVLSLRAGHPEDLRRVARLMSRMMDEEPAASLLRDMANAQIAHLTRLKANVLDARAAADRAEAADRAMFADAPSAALLLRYETAASREMSRALADLIKLRKEADRMREDDCDARPSSNPAPTARDRREMAPVPVASTGEEARPPSEPIAENNDTTLFSGTSSAVTPGWPDASDVARPASEDSGSVASEEARLAGTPHRGK